MCFSLFLAYAGATCAEDRNGCMSGGGCYPNVTCTDNPAPAIGAECGPCPTGLTGDGVMCTGKAKLICTGGGVEVFYII